MIFNSNKNLKSGIVYGFIFKIVTLVMPFIVQTAIIKTLGAEYAGVKSLFTSILSVLSLVELGFGNAIVYSMYEPISNDNIPKISALLNLYRKLYKIIGAVIFILGMAVIPFLSYLVKGSYPDGININYVFFLYILNTVIPYLTFSYRSSLLYAYQRTDKISIIGTACHFFMSMFQLFAIRIFANFYAFLILSVVFSFVENLIIYLVSKRMFPEIKCAGTIDKTSSNEIKIKTFGVLIGKLCGVTRNTFDSIFISAFLGLTQATVYSNYFFVLSAISAIMVSILNALLPVVGNHIVCESRNDNYKNLLEFDSLYMMIAGIITSCMLCLYQPFMLWWVGKDFVLPFYVMILFPTYFYITMMGNIRSVYSDAAGLFWENRYRTILEMISNIILNYIFVRYFGIFGIVLATIITLFIFGFICSTFVAFKHYFKSGIKTYFLHQAKYLISSFFISLITYYISSILKFNLSLISLIFRAIICGSISLVLSIIFYRKTPYINKTFHKILEK